MIEAKEILKPGAVLRDWKEQPLTEEEKMAIGHVFPKSNKCTFVPIEDQQRMWLQLHTPMSI